MDSFLFNPEYHLRQDGNRVILFSDEEVSDRSEEWFSFIHPYHAMMLSFFDGQSNFQDEIEACASFFHLPFEKMKEIVEKFLYKEHWFTIRSGNYYINFPKNILIQVEVGNAKRKDYPTPTNFSYYGEPDYNTIRLKYPISINMELTMKCYANCSYCYANRKLNDKSMLTLSEIKDVIRQAKKNGVYQIDINGGDVVLHPHIKEILQELVSCGYTPLVSTKTTLSKEMIDYVISLKDVRLQISLDTIDSQILHKLIGVPENYLTEMSKSLAYLSEKRAKIQINDVLTKYNSSIAEIKKLLDYLTSYNTVKEVRFSPCGCSIYRKGFKNLILSSKQMDTVLLEIARLKSSYPNLIIKTSPFDRKEEYVSTHKKEIFQTRALCTGGTRSAVILPNGDMTICEELYDHPAFVLGNVRNTSIREVWNSSKATSLYQTPTDPLSTSPCKNCTSRTECRTGVGVCWKLVLLAYGSQHWDYPDPRCPQAPKFLKDFYYE